MVTTTRLGGNVYAVDGQGGRIEALVEFGHFNRGARAQRRFASLHRLRARNATSRRQEGWN